jgi:Na+-driven multidrug efflux pump
MITQAYSTRGLNGVAAINIANTIYSFFCIVLQACGSAVAIIIGQELGAGKIEQAKADDKKLLFFTTFLNLFIGALIIFTARFFPTLYNTSDEVRSLATTLLIIVGTELPIEAYIYATYFTIRSGGKTGITFLFDCGFTWVVSLPIVFLLCHFTDLSIPVIFFCAQYANLIKLVLGAIMVHNGFWAKKIVHTEEPAESSD